MVKVKYEGLVSYRDSRGVERGEIIFTRTDGMVFFRELNNAIYTLVSGKNPELYIEAREVLKTDLLQMVTTLSRGNSYSKNVTENGTLQIELRRVTE